MSCCPKVIWIDNTIPPTSYIWMKTDLNNKLIGVYEYIKNKWTEIDLDLLLAKQYYSRQEIDILIKYVEQEILRKIAYGEYDIEQITVDSKLDLFSKNPVQNSVVTEALLKKQDKIADLAQIRENALYGRAAYIKPGDGIPKEDLEASISRNLTILAENIDKLENLIDTFSREQVLELISDFITRSVDDLENYYTKAQVDSKLSEKQDTLVSGENIKTINGTSILGEGDLHVITSLAEAEDDPEHRLVTDAEKEVWNSKADVSIGTTEYWNNRIGYIPDAGKIIIYTDYRTENVNGNIINIPGIKIGSGNGFVQDLAFVGDDVRDDLLAHIRNTDVHVTVEDKDRWNNKLNVTDSHEVVNENLIFNRN